MTIVESLGEAWLVNKYVLRANQSPNAIAKGDLFCLHSEYKVWRLRLPFLGGAQCTKLIPVASYEPPMRANK